MTHTDECLKAQAERDAARQECIRLQQGEEVIRQILVRTFAAAVAGYADAAIIQQQTMDVRHVANAVAQLGECAREWKAERDAAVVEAAALREALLRFHRHVGDRGENLPCGGCVASAALSQPGPGAALLTRLRAMEDALRSVTGALRDITDRKPTVAQMTRRNIALLQAADALSAATPAGGE